MTDPALLYNGFTASDPEAQRKNEIEAVTKLLEQNPNNPYWQSRYNELVIKPIYGENWEQDADRLHELLKSDSAVKQCELCELGVMDLGYGTPLPFPHFRHRRRMRKRSASNYQMRNG